jgi:uncharacterized protein YndB with AHSA1/START domain
MTAAAPTTETTQVNRVWIRATPQAIWDAITKRDWSDRYGYGGFPEYPEGLKAGAPYRVLAGTGMQAQGVSGPVVEGELVEVDPPRRFSQTWRLIMDEATAAEPFTRVSYDIEPQDGGVTRLTVTHELEGAPRTAAMVSGAHEEAGAGGGWAWVLSDLKTLLETGAPLAG